jgi:large subunit ribosomal protein L31
MRLRGQQRAQKQKRRGACRRPAFSVFAPVVAKKSKYATIHGLMKTDIHPKNYRKVIFRDVSSGTDFLIASTTDSKETAKWTDGNEYPLVIVEISSKSHPFYTGTDKQLDTAGRAEKFKARAAKKIGKK